jgi:hypothetical protein
MKYLIILLILFSSITATAQEEIAVDTIYFIDTLIDGETFYQTQRTLILANGRDLSNKSQRMDSTEFARYLVQKAREPMESLGQGYAIVARKKEFNNIFDFFEAGINFLNGGNYFDATEETFTNDLLGTWTLRSADTLAFFRANDNGLLEETVSRNDTTLVASGKTFRVKHYEKRFFLARAGIFAGNATRFIRTGEERDKKNRRKWTYSPIDDQDFKLIQLR